MFLLIVLPLLLLQAFSNFRLLAFMIVAWIMGVGIGLIFTFLFWHLQVSKIQRMIKVFIEFV